MGEYRRVDMVEESLTDFEMKSKYFQLQAQMINVGILKGLTHPETIKYSQELDVLINQFQKINLVNSEMKISK